MGGPAQLDAKLRYVADDGVAVVTTLSGVDEARLQIAKDMDHHSDSDVQGEQVTLRLTTPGVGGVAELDVERSWPPASTRCCPARNHRHRPRTPLTQPARGGAAQTASPGRWRVHVLRRPAAPPA